MTKKRNSWSLYSAILFHWTNNVCLVKKRKSWLIQNLSLSFVYVYILHDESRAHLALPIFSNFVAQATQVHIVTFIDTTGWDIVSICEREQKINYFIWLSEFILKHAHSAGKYRHHYIPRTVDSLIHLIISVFFLNMCTLQMKHRYHSILRTANSLILFIVSAGWNKYHYIPRTVDSLIQWLIVVQHFMEFCVIPYFMFCSEEKYFLISWNGKYQSMDNTKNMKRKRNLLPKNNEISKQKAHTNTQKN